MLRKHGNKKVNCKYNLLNFFIVTKSDMFLHVYLIEIRTIVLKDEIKLSLIGLIMLNGVKTH